MMRSINKVILIGNLTRDPEMRQTPNGQTVTTFGIATNREWVTKSGDKKSSAEFHELVAWARLAEICNNYLRKGKLVYIEGYLKTRSWDTPEGVKKFKTEIVIQDMIMLEKKPEDEDYFPESDNAMNDKDDNNEEISSKKSTEKKNKETQEETPAKTKKEENPIDKDLGL
ncbi:single-stranded DNA-binding protein [Candidatus Peregrinibacteria bacterium]|nr:single-stranded DNA-binding protein [Candidatus Peregrinibacteria bacterium]